MVALVVLLSAAPAAAHGDEGMFSGTEATPGEGLTVDVRARLLYVNDNEPAPGAFVIVDAIDAAGATTPPALLTDNRDGTYVGTLTLPASGAWTLRFNATTPTATAEIAYTAETPTTTTPATTSTARSGGGNGKSDDDGIPMGIVALGVVGAGAAGAGGWLLWRRGGRGTA